ncbi:MAG: 7-carboxy-7-deazaguanine synthase QueE [Candidatus Eremiobacteraeota bacterium]|nr:7-carboxy-7-deazaguanine synthase QueE [Candidatus Eremiobacteraeota bacterium]
MCAQAAAELTTLKVNETFVSVQGEGSLIGQPSFFIRLDGCPLRCRWCDTPYALAGDAGREVPVSDLVRSAGPYRHVVITGGEPLAQDIRPLVESLRGHHVTVETSGTIFAQLPQVALFSLSPKIGTSGYAPKPLILRRYCASAAGRMQLKFVIGDAADLDQACACVSGLADVLPRETPIIFQPESGRAGGPESYGRFLRWLAEAVLERDDLRSHAVAVLPQLHFLLWHGAAGR